MADKPIVTNPQVLGEVAAGHEEVARVIEAARDRGADIHSAVQSYGPIMHQVKDAVFDLLVDRDNALAHHRDRHRKASDELNRAACRFVATNDEEEARLRPENL
jgi:Excreted virulence factor EspC, type VII ESX diderm